MRIIVLAALAGLALAQPSGASAQEPAREPDASPIVVQGTRDRDRQIANFVEALTDAPFRGQLSRFDWAVCPAAVGLSDAQNRDIAARMRRVAAGAGIDVAEGDCRPNVLVMIAGSKRGLIESLARRYPAYFTDISRRGVRRLARSEGPAAAWHVETLVGSDGRPMQRDILTGQYALETSADATRLRPMSRPHFVMAVVVVEAASLAGLTTTQVADYAAMRAFARTDPARLENAAAPTILTVLDAPMGSAVPITLTQWDLSFLRSLYAAPEGHYVNQQRRDIRHRMRRDLDRAQGEQE